ncbi:hypothetical protein [Afifella pfennigii]|uniref:hypothetical protein n=1 Tax=Afifella pfennigii TaxID=209897 RepID=UPI00047A90B7|nr:hypothetical protein [Afifella pfennigii]
MTLDLRIGGRPSPFVHRIIQWLKWPWPVQPGTAPAQLDLDETNEGRKRDLGLIDGRAPRRRDPMRD